MESRNRKLTATLNLMGSGIEYGPLDKPILAKPKHNVRYVDYASRENLAAHYAHDPNVDKGRIPEIDIVTGGHSADKFIAANSLDYVVASHVWEHVPDFLGWLESNLTILRRGGRLAVAYPDKRYTFDLRRNSSRISDIIAAYVAKSTKPTLAQLADHFINAVRVSPQAAWSGAATDNNVPPIHAPEKIIPLLTRLRDSDKYNDCHCWTFADYELPSALEALRQFVTLQFRVVDFIKTARDSHEFYISIEKC